MRRATRAMLTGGAFMGLYVVTPACGPSKPSHADTTRAAADEASTVTGRRCGVTDTSHVGNRGVGDLQIGVPLRKLQQRCRIIRDTVEYNAEAVLEHLVRVDLGRDTAVAAVDSTASVSRIEIRTRHLKSVDGVGVGTKLRQLTTRTDVAGWELEGRLYVTWPTYCGVSFGMRYPGADDAPREHWARSDLLSLPQDAEVDEIIVAPCAPAEKK